MKTIVIVAAGCQLPAVCRSSFTWCLYIRWILWVASVYLTTFMIRVLDYVQTAVFTSAKSAHYVEILRPGRKWKCKSQEDVSNFVYFHSLFFTPTYVVTVVIFPMLAQAPKHQCSWRLWTIGLINTVRPAKTAICRKFLGRTYVRVKFMAIWNPAHDTFKSCCLWITGHL